MNSKRIAALMLAAMLAATVWAGDKGHHTMAVKLISDQGRGESAVYIDSEDLDIDVDVHAKVHEVLKVTE